MSISPRSLKILFSFSVDTFLYRVFETKSVGYNFSKIFHKFFFLLVTYSI